MQTPFAPYLLATGKNLQPFAPDSRVPVSNGSSKGGSKLRLHIPIINKSVDASPENRWRRYRAL